MTNEGFYRFSEEMMKRILMPVSFDGRCILPENAGAAARGRQRNMQVCSALSGRCGGDAARAEHGRTGDIRRKNMGVPIVDVKFKELTSTAVARSERGIVALILEDDSGLSETLSRCGGRTRGLEQRIKGEDCHGL